MTEQNDAGFTAAELNRGARAFARLGVSAQQYAAALRQMITASEKLADAFKQARRSAIRRAIAQARMETVKSRPGRRWRKREARL